MKTKKILIIGTLILAASTLIICGTITAHSKITKMKETITKEVTAKVKKEVMEEVEEKIKAELQKVNQEAPCTKKENTKNNASTLNSEIMYEI